MLYSALVHLRSGVCAQVFILADDLPGDLRASVSRVVTNTDRLVEVYWISAPDYYQGFPLRDQLSRTTYARQDMGDLLPANLDRVIYLDSDMLVLSDLVDLWEVDVGGYALLATRHWVIPTVSSRLTGVNSTWSILDIDPDAPYFDAALLVVDLMQWRQLCLTQKMMDYLRAYSHTLKSPNQDVMNAVIAGHWNALEADWNVSVPLLRNPEYISGSVRSVLGLDPQALRKTGRILHFWGPRKPWNALVSEPLAWRWWRYLRRCGWFTPGRAVFEQARWIAMAICRLARRLVA
jgi:lipopolysaccharide biosynthesis glycosyltransferase